MFMRRRFGLGVAGALAIAGCLPASSLAVVLPCSGSPGAVTPFSLKIPNGQHTTGLHDYPGKTITGIYALPARPPKGIVVFAHGHDNTPEGAWEQHLSDTATNDGVIAVAMDYYDPNPPSPNPSGGPEDYGWRVAEGADFSIAAADAFYKSCHPQTIAMFGVSMGGNTAGLAVAEKATRLHSTQPLFDYLFDVEGAMNVAETYLEATATQNYAQREIEEEMGGSLAQVPTAYRSRTVVARTGAIARSGVKGVVIVHAATDGLVPYDQSREFAAGLAAHNVPASVFTVGTRNKIDTTNPNPLNLTGDCEGQTTLDGYVTGNIPNFCSPMAGHGWEGSTTQLVIMTGFHQLDALFNEGQAPSGYHEYFVDKNVSAAPVTLF
jgi:hypothetical protein